LQWVEDQWYCRVCGDEWPPNDWSGEGEHGEWARITEGLRGADAHRTNYWNRAMADGRRLTVSRYPEPWTWKVHQVEPRRVVEQGRCTSVRAGKQAAFDAWSLVEAS
jgi:hypothetical protein